MIDRLSVRARPSGQPLLHQIWRSLLFMHWPIAVEAIRRRVPAELEIDTFEGAAWIGLTPFTIGGVRPNHLPAIPIVSSTHELNVRTYVVGNGVPGVWFFSLDASNPLAVVGSRLGYALPYYQAFMTLRKDHERVGFTSYRMHPGAPEAHLEASWVLQEPIGAAEPGSLDFFLIERYCLYAKRAGRLYRSRIHHHPWPLRKASVSALDSTMLKSHSLPTPNEQPLVHAQAAPLHVEVWPPERVR